MLTDMGWLCHCEAKQWRAPTRLGRSCSRHAGSTTLGEGRAIRARPWAAERLRLRAAWAGKAPPRATVGGLRRAGQRARAGLPPPQLRGRLPWLPPPFIFSSEEKMKLQALVGPINWACPFFRKKKTVFSKKWYFSKLFQKTVIFQNSFEYSDIFIKQF